MIKSMFSISGKGYGTSFFAITDSEEVYVWNSEIGFFRHDAMMENGMDGLKNHIYNMVVEGLNITAITAVSYIQEIENKIKMFKEDYDHE